MEVHNLTKDAFTRLNKRAIERNYNRSVEPKFVKSLGEDLRFPIIETWLHNDTEMRCQIAFNSVGDTCWLDIALADFNVLPTVDTEA